MFLNKILLREKYNIDICQIKRIYFTIKKHEMYSFPWNLMTFTEFEWAYCGENVTN